MMTLENMHNDQNKKIQPVSEKETNKQKKLATVSKVNVNSAKQQPNDVHPSLFKTGCTGPVYSRARSSCSTIACNTTFAGLDFHWWGRWRMCLWRRDIVPGLLRGISCLRDLCKAAVAEDKRMLPAAWEMLAEDTLTTDSSLPSSLTSRVRMSSSNTAIVLLRSAARKKKNNHKKTLHLRKKKYWFFFILFLEHTIAREVTISCCDSSDYWYFIILP